MPSHGKTTPPRQTLTVTVLGLTLVLLGTLYALRLNETPIGAITDDAYYIEMARSIAEGNGPAIQTGPDAAIANPDIFPAGFPYLLSPLARIFPDSLGALKLVPLIGTLLLAPLCFWLPGTDTSNRWRLMIAAVVMFNPWVIAWSGRILSDNIFAALSLAALMGFILWQAQNRFSWRGFIILALLCSLVVSVRTIGWAAVLAMATTLMLNRRWAWAVALPATVGLCLLPVWLFVPNSAGLLTGGYASQMLHSPDGGILRFALDNTLHYIAELPVIMVPLFGTPVANAMQHAGMGVLYPATAYLAGALLLVLIGLAIVKGWQSPRVRLFALYLGFTGAALANFDGYPSGVQTRLLIPILPILVWLVLDGIGHMPVIGGRRGTIVVFSFMMLASLAHNGWRIANPVRTSVAADGSGFVDPGVGADWILTSTTTSDVVMAQEPLQRHIHFRRPVVAFAETLSAGALAEKVEQYDVRFVFIGPVVHHQPNCLDTKGQAMLEILQAQPALYRPVHADAARSIYIFNCAD